MLALSSVIKRPISAHYPDFGLLVNRLVFDCEIFPKANDSFCPNSFGDPKNILSCNISDNSENNFTANHFVSLIKHTTSKKGQSTLAKRVNFSSSSNFVSSKRIKHDPILSIKYFSLFQIDQ